MKGNQRWLQSAYNASTIHMEASNPKWYRVGLTPWTKFNPNNNIHAFSLYPLPLIFLTSFIFFFFIVLELNTKTNLLYSILTVTSKSLLQTNHPFTPVFTYITHPISISTTSLHKHLNRDLVATIPPLFFNRVTQSMKSKSNLARKIKEKVDQWNITKAFFDLYECI